MHCKRCVRKVQQRCNALANLLVSKFFCLILSFSIHLNRFNKAKYNSILQEIIFVAVNSFIFHIKRLREISSFHFIIHKKLQRLFL